MSTSEKKSSPLLPLLGTWLAFSLGAWALLWLVTEVVTQAKELIEVLN